MEEGAVRGPFFLCLHPRPLSLKGRGEFDRRVVALSHRGLVAGGRAAAEVAGPYATVVWSCRIGVLVALDDAG